jgi:hypothetical protein
VVSGQRKFNPGIFKVTCPHGVVYGFHFMKDHESPSDLFTLLLTRWPRDRLLPALMWYDNMCKAYEYIIKREPWMLKFMRAVVDSFHYGSSQQVPLHKCPRCFDTKAHTVAARFNSQYEEHGNAYLSLFRNSLRTMALPRARELVGTVLKCWGGQKLEKIRLELQAEQKQYQEVCSWLAWGLPEADQAAGQGQQGEAAGQAAQQGLQGPAAGRAAQQGQQGAAAGQAGQQGQQGTAAGQAAGHG